MKQKCRTGRWGLSRVGNHGKEARIHGRNAREEEVHNSNKIPLAFKQLCTFRSPRYFVKEAKENEEGWPLLGEMETQQRSDGKRTREGGKRSETTNQGLRRGGKSGAAVLVVVGGRGREKARHPASEGSAEPGEGGEGERKERRAAAEQEARGVRVLWGNVGGRSLGSRAGHSRSRAACSLLSFGPDTTARAAPCSPQAGAGYTRTSERARAAKGESDSSVTGPERLVGQRSLAAPPRGNRHPGRTPVGRRSAPKDVSAEDTSFPTSTFLPTPANIERLMRHSREEAYRSPGGRYSCDIYHGTLHPGPAKTERTSFELPRAEGPCAWRSPDRPYIRARPSLGVAQIANRSSDPLGKVSPKGGPCPVRKEATAKGSVEVITMLLLPFWWLACTYPVTLAAQRGKELADGKGRPGLFLPRRHPREKSTRWPCFHKGKYPMRTPQIERHRGQVL
ncbi:hypothetical protein KM043_006992 [Ampulex compressa]|nr:hypothetical protein KM043_006992 [Ampulex compressa]